MWYKPLITLTNPDKSHSSSTVHAGSMPQRKRP
jgi:hypothetical protein